MTTPIYKQKRYLIPTLFLFLLICLRVMLPTLVKNYMNTVLATSIPGYVGKVEDVGISLYRGAYQLNGFTLKAKNSNSEIPFLKLPNNDISIQWNALFRGKIVGKLFLRKPQINIVKEDQKTQPVTDVKEDDWTKTLTNIVPIDINIFEIEDGKISFKEITSKPKIDLDIHDINLSATNLRNVKSVRGKLPSTLKITGTSIGNGDLNINGKLDLIKEIPDIDIAMEFTKIDITALNAFTKHYAGIDFEKGTIDMFSEIVIADSYLKGYIKPLIKKTKLIGKDDTFIDSIWEGLIGFTKFVFRNQSNKVIATKIPLEGDLSNVSTNVWLTVGSVIKNAWIKAFENNVDDTIDYKKVLEEKKD